MKKAYKSLFSLLLILSIVICLCVSATAAASPLAKQEIEIPVIYVDGFVTEAQIGQIIDSRNAKSTNISELYALVSRSGTSTTCYLSLAWPGTDTYSAWRYKKFTVKSDSYLFPTTYATFGTGSSYTTLNAVPASTRSLFIGSMTIPTNVTKVVVKPSSLQGYRNSTQSWLSSLGWSGSVEIR